MKKLLLFLCLIPLIAEAQYSVTGRVVDAATHQPLEFVNVIAGTNGAMTDEEGMFALLNMKEGEHEIVISFVGYISTTKKISIHGTDINIGRIRLEEDAQTLQEVQVVGQGTTMRFELDKKIFTVDQNIANAGGSVTDALDNIPTVDVDQEGNISLRGSESVEIWINGKPSGLTAENRADIMRQMPAESIKEIEVITNPSAKFSPEGSSGVINIVMKKDRKAGYYGSWTVGLEYALAKPWNIPPGANTSVNLNFSKGIVDGYFNIGYRFNTHNGNNESTRYMLDGMGTRYLSDIPAEKIQSVLRTRGSQDNRGHGMFLRAGVNIHASDRSTIGISGFGMLSEPNAFRSRNNNRTDYVQTDYLSGDTTRLYSRTEEGYGWHPGGNATVDYTFKMQSHQLMVSAQYNHWTWNGNQTYTTRMLDEISSQQKQENNNLDQTVEIKADYEWKPTPQSRLEAGYQARLNRKYSGTTTINGLTGLEIPELNDEFRSREQNHAIYITYGNKFWKTFSVLVGLRGELYKRNLDSYGTDTTYFQLYPSVYLSYDFGKGNELQLNYTRRVDRPWGHTLNPKQNITDSTNISCGNPDLLPSFSNNMELNYLKTWERHTLSIGAFWRYKEGLVQNVTFMDGQQMRNTWVNAGNRHDVGGDITVKNRLAGELLQMTTSLECYYNTMRGGEYNFLYAGRPGSVTLNRQSAVTWSAKIQLNFLFTKTFSGQIGGRYRSPQVLAQGYSTHSYNIDLGLRKTFLDRRLALAFNVRDILDSRARRSTTWGQGFIQDSQRRWHSRSVSLTLTYNFGTNNKKKNEKNDINSYLPAGDDFDASQGAGDAGWSD